MSTQKNKNTYEVYTEYFFQPNSYNIPKNHKTLVNAQNEFEALSIVKEWGGSYIALDEDDILQDRLEPNYHTYEYAWERRGSGSHGKKYTYKYNSSITGPYRLQHGEYAPPTYHVRKKHNHVDLHGIILDS